MWTIPSVVSIFARWLPSRTSSTIRGWRLSASPTFSAWACVGAMRSTQTLASGSPRARPSRPSRPCPRARRRRRRAWRRPGSCPAAPAGRSHAFARLGRRAGSPAGRQRARPGSGASRPSASDPPAAAASVASFAAGASSSIRVRVPREPPRARLGGIATALDRGGHDEQADHDRGRLARRPVLQRADDQRVAQRPIAQGLGDELLVARRAGVDLDVQPVDGRRAVRGQDRQPDRHPDHPRDGHDRRGRPERAAGRPPRPPPSSAA